MDKNIDIIGNIINFLIVSLIFIGVLGILFKLTLKNYNVKTSKIKFYGLFLGMNNSSIISFCLITLNYIFLIWCTASFSGINVIYGFITVICILLADLFIKEFKKIPMDMLFCVINILCIYVTSLLYKYLTTKYTSIFLLIILGLVIIFVFLYYTYITFRFLNSVVVKQENLQKKKYKKI